eukprot:CAMPEP_0117437704 /NCGR_PEP_ID=MMETSP0759-20121206/1668_1 /TAXON_ID=63605 /ORGANISM="Percolomonas cosmopolitus, Strain WS" /LENGTH=1889 /DNA_ID=CAMNT_0005229359 /DNA_START=168 /DNA_END=5837 /DNA_ORIENTATION=+
MIQQDLTHLIPGLSYKFPLANNYEGTYAAASIDNFQNEGLSVDVAIRIIVKSRMFGTRQAIIHTLRTLYEISTEEIEMMMMRGSEGSAEGEKDIISEVHQPAKGEKVTAHKKHSPLPVSKKHKDELESREIISVLSPVKKRPTTTKVDSIHQDAVFDEALQNMHGSSLHKSSSSPKSKPTTNQTPTPQTPPKPLFPPSPTKSSSSPRGGNLLIGVFAPRHANIPRLLGVYESSRAFYIIVDYHPYSLSKIISTDLTYILTNNEITRRFLFFQLVQTVIFSHRSGYALGDIRPTNVLVNEMLWTYFSGFSLLYNSQNTIISSRSSQKKREQSDVSRSVGKKVYEWDMKAASFSSLNTFSPGEKVIIPRSSGCFTYGRVAENQPDHLARIRVYRLEKTSVSVGGNSMSHHGQQDTSSSLYRGLKDLPVMSIGKISTHGMEAHSSLQRSLQDSTFHHESLLIRWQHGEISNYDYLMALNLRAGRRRGNCYFHPILPWVIDFTQQHGNWRDLSKSKFRLDKGDEMLDRTFWETEHPHHISEPLSEVTFYIYLARVTSKVKLSRFVRSTFDSKHYPQSMERLYQWTPEECIPEFYDDPNIFKSIHEDLPDLQLPEWASSPEDFIEKHREVLESEHVSKYLHLWIDLLFGYKLTGRAAIEAKNVMLSNRYTSDRIFPEKPGFVQLFFDPHPLRLCAYFPDHYRHIPSLQKWFQSEDVSDRGNFDDEPASDTAASGGDNDFHQGGTLMGPSSSVNEEESSYWRNNLQVYESSFAFTQKYFQKPAYHAIPLLMADSRKQIPQLDLFSDDLFALGALLAEMYTFRPLFTTQTLASYMRGEYDPDLQKIPYPARSLVKVLIAKDSVARKKFLSLPCARKYFPSYFKYSYWFLSQFYSFKTYQEMLHFVDGESAHLESISTEGFEMTFAHVLHALFNQEEMWRPMLEFLSHSNKIRVRIESLSKESTIHKLLRTRFSSLYLHCSDPHIQQLLFSYKITHLVCYLYGKTSTIFLENILFAHIDALFDSKFEVATESSHTLCLLSKRDLGVVLTFSYIIERILVRMQRGDKQDPQRNRIALYFLLSAAKLHQPSVCLSYYTPKFLKIIRTYVRAQEPDGDLINLLALLDRLIQDVTAVNVFDTLVTNNVRIFVELLSSPTELTVGCFDRLAGVMCHLLQQCSMQTRLSALSELKPILELYFGCTVTLDEKVKSALSYLSSTASGANLAKEQSANTPPKRNSRLWKFTSVMKRIANSNSSTNPSHLSSEILTSDNLFTLMELSPSKSEEISSHPSNSAAQEESPSDSPSSSSSQSNTIPKQVMRKSCILYGYICRVVGNSIMSSAVENASIFEDYLQRQAESIFQADTEVSSQEFISSANEEDMKISFDDHSGEGDTHNTNILAASGRDVSAETGSDFTMDSHDNSPLLHAGQQRVSDPIATRSRLPGLEVSLDDDSITEKFEAFDEEESSVTVKLESMASKHNSFVASSVSQKNQHETWWLASKPDAMRRLTTSRSHDWKFHGILEHELATPRMPNKHHAKMSNSPGLMARASSNKLSARCLAVNPRDERIVLTTCSSQSSNFLTCWNIDESFPKCFFDEGKHRKPIVHTDFLNDRVCVSSADGRIHLWDLQQAKHLHTFSGGRSRRSGLGGSGNIVSSALSQGAISKAGIFDIDREDSLIASSTVDSTIRFFDPRTKKHIYEWKLWNVPSGSSFHSYPHITSLKFDHSIRKLCVGLSSGNCFLLDFSTGIIMDSFRTTSKEREVNGFGLFHDELLFTCAGGSKASRIKLWDVSESKAKCVYTFRGATPEMKFTDMDCNSELNALFAVSSSGAICHCPLRDISSHVKRWRYYGSASAEPDESLLETYKPKSIAQSSFSAVKILPLLRLVLALDSDGSIKIFK